MRDGQSRYVSTDFRKCEKADFENNGYYKDLPQNLDSLMCPDVESVKDFYRIMNGYTHAEHFDSFAIEIIACSKEWQGENFCADATEIEHFVSHLVFT